VSLRRPPEVDGFEQSAGLCIEEPGPCPNTRCRHHLASDETPLRLSRADLTEPCVLRLANRGPHTLEQVGQILGITRERTRQIELKALTRLRNRSPMLEHRPTGSA
jgi:hypothetical protein